MLKSSCGEAVGDVARSRVGYAGGVARSRRLRVRPMVAVTSGLRSEWVELHTPRFEDAMPPCISASMSRPACPGKFCRDVWHTLSRPAHPADPLEHLERRNLNQRCRG